MRKALASLLSAALLGGATHSSQISERDFQQLMETATVASAAPYQVQPLTTTVCVNRQLQPPVTDLRALSGWFVSVRPSPSAGASASGATIAAAMSGKVSVVHQTKMPPLPSRFVLFDGTPPPGCVVSHSGGRGPNWQKDESVVVLSFTRPVLARGYAFLEEYEECPGLCGTTFLRAFRKEGGKWTQVAASPLSVS